MNLSEVDRADKLLPVLTVLRSASDRDFAAKRIFDAVVRPERQKVNGDVGAEKERLRKEVERGEKMLGNPRFVERAPAEVVQAERDKLERYRRELDALDALD